MRQILQSIMDVEDEYQPFWLSLGALRFISR